MSRALAGVVSLVLIGATLSPLLRPPDQDDFPLSTYPMFAWKRPTQLTMSYALAVTPAGTRAIAPRLVGSAEVLQARATIERAVRQGRGELTTLCQRIAANVRGAPGHDDVTQIRIVTGTHDAIDFLVRGVRGPEHERTSCWVRR